jgi:hypothetical protein
MFAKSLGAAQSHQIWLIFERFVGLDHIESGVLAAKKGIYYPLDANDGLTP